MGMQGRWLLSNFYVLYFFFKACITSYSFINYLLLKNLAIFFYTLLLHRVRAAMSAILSLAERQQLLTHYIVHESMQQRATLITSRLVYALHKRSLMSIN